VTYESMMRGIAAVKPGGTTGDIGPPSRASSSAAHERGARLLRPRPRPPVPRRAEHRPSTARPGEGSLLKPGMFFTVEPMINLGRPHVKVLSDGWTAVTRDRSLSAQFEHTVGQ
jgi:methionyl aminopeptidase